MMRSIYVKRSLLAIATVVAGLMIALVPLLAVGLVSNGIAQVLGKAPPPPLQPCGGAIVWGNGGYQCDGPLRPDGSFERCTSVYVLGIGGMSCYIVYPPPP